MITSGHIHREVDVRLNLTFYEFIFFSKSVCKNAVILTIRYEMHFYRQTCLNLL